MGVRRRFGVGLGLLLPLLLVDCKGDDRAAGREALRVYTRASLDLRGVRPTWEEAQIILGSPELLEDQIGRLADDPRFGWQIALMYAPTWGTRVDESDVMRLDLGMEDEARFLTSVGEEPLRILAWIADHDLPWTDIVRADWTMADEALAGTFPVDYPAGETGWRQVHYTDGRPTAGILSSSGMWWRYSTTFNNGNRGRVNALSRILMCRDYLDMAVEFPNDLDLTDEDAVRQAVLTNEACLTCHREMDPIGAYLWGFYAEFSNSRLDWAYYHPDREHDWEYLGVPPAWFGEEGHTLDDLGRQMAADPRIIDCLVKRSYEGLVQRELLSEEQTELWTHRQAFLDGGVTLRALFRSLVTAPAYRRFDGPDGVAKLVTPDLYASMVDDLTGFRFAADGHDAIAADYLGFRTMAGGGRVSGVNIPVPSPTMVEVQDRIATAAGAWVAQNDLADPASPRLLAGVETATRPGDGAFEAAVQRLYLRVLDEDVALDGYEVATATELWSTVFAATDDPAAAWGAVVTGLLRDPAFVVY